MASMESDTTSELNILAGTAILGVVIVLAFFLLKIVRASGTQEDDTSEEVHEKRQTKEVKKSNGSKGDNKTKEKKRVPKKTGRHIFSHPWLSCSLKGHNGETLGMDFSSNGKYLATCSDDRSVLLWSVKDFSGTNHKCVRGNVEYDHATKIKWSPDNKALVISLGMDNTVRVLRIGKKEDGSVGNITGVLDFADKHDSEILDIGIASTGHFIMTCYTDTLLKVWNIKGDLLHTVDSKQMKHSHGAVSPCGRYIVSSGFTPDVKAWYVKFDKGGNFQEVKSAWQLKGHSAKIHHFAFTNDSTRVATVSSDMTWRIWDVDVELDRGGDPRVLHQGNHSFMDPCRVSLSHDFRSLTLSCGASLAMYDVLGGSEEHMQDVHAGRISDLAYSNCNKFLISVGDQQIQVFHNVMSFRAAVNELEEKLLNESKGGSKLARERIAKQLEDARKRLLVVKE